MLTLRAIFHIAAGELATTRRSARQWRLREGKPLPKLHPRWRELKAAEDAFDNAWRELEGTD